MSDRISAEISIGGPVHVDLVPALCRAITAESLGTEWGDTNFEPLGTADLMDALDENDHLSLKDEESTGSFDGLETFLKKHGVPFDRRSDAKYENDAYLACWRPPDQAYGFLATQSGNPVVEVEEVEKIRSMLLRYDAVAEDRAAAALAALEKLIPAVPQLPPFTIAE